MSERVANPFVTMEINAPSQYQEFFRRYSQTTGATNVSEIDRKPFPRMVDFWFLALCVAVNKGLKPTALESKDTYKAVEGPQIASPEWRAHVLKLIALQQTGDPNIVNDPRKILEIANGLAFAGMPHLIEILQESPGEEVFAISDAFVKMIEQK
jgi:hypothetical protein